MEFLLPAEIRKVIYLDSDTLVVDSIEEMKKTENLFSAVVESGKDGYFNSGVFQTDLVFWRDNNLIEQFEKYLNENPNSLYKDQDALNFVFGSRNKDLDPKFNFQVKNRHSSRDVAILHFSGSRKPWYRSTPNDYYVNIWRTYAKEILGSEYKLTKRRFDLIRKMILNLESLISK
jgi:lipopolysaccharide biosynthesis glycosyltransferase